MDFFTRLQSRLFFHKGDPTSSSEDKESVSRTDTRQEEDSSENDESIAHGYPNQVDGNKALPLPLLSRSEDESEQMQASHEGLFQDPRDFPPNPWYHDQGESFTSVVQETPHLLDNLSRGLFDLIMGERREKVCTLRLMVLGGAGRGKTSTVNSIRGRPFNDSCEATRGVELSIHALLLGSDQLTDQHVQKCIESQTFYGKISTLRNEFSTKIDPNVYKHTHTDPNYCGFHLDEHGTEFFESACEAFKQSDNFTDLNGNILRCWDFGGQKEYEMAHELFISPLCILMFVFNLENYSRADTRAAELKELTRWMQTVYSVVRDPNNVRVIILGTHSHSCLSVDGDEPSDIGALLKAFMLDLEKGLTSAVHDAWIREGTKGSATVLALENKVATSDPWGSGLEKLIQTLTGAAESLASENKDVPLRWIGFVERLRKHTDLYLTKEKTILDAFGFPGFTTPILEVSDPELKNLLRSGVEQEVKLLLRVLHNLGELVLFETSEDDYAVFLEPEKILAPLRSIIAPKDVLRARLHKYEKTDLDKGLLEVKTLETLWPDYNQEQRETMLNLFCAFGLLMKLHWREGKRQVGIPALRPKQGDDFKWSSKNGELEIKCITECLPFRPSGISGVLIAHLHCKIGDEKTDASLIRSDAAILTTREGVRVFVGFLPEDNRISWIFRSRSSPSRLLESIRDVLLQVNELAISPIRPRQIELRHIVVVQCECEEGKVEFDLSCLWFRSGSPASNLPIETTESRCNFCHAPQNLGLACAELRESSVPTQPSRLIPQKLLGSSTPAAVNFGATINVGNDYVGDINVQICNASGNRQ